MIPALAWCLEDMPIEEQGALSVLSSYAVSFWGRILCLVDLMIQNIHLWNRVFDIVEKYVGPTLTLVASARESSGIKPIE